MNIEELQNLKIKILEQAENANAIEDLNDIQSSYLSKKGKIPLIMAEIKNVPQNHRACLDKLLILLKKN